MISGWMRLIAMLLASLVTWKAAAAEAKPELGRINRVMLEAIYASGWERYKTRFVAPEGRIVDDGNRGISHSEGQGYGLLLAVWGKDREAFDRIWRWTDSTLFVREDGLAAWAWDPSEKPNIKDANNASDGDLLIAWGLVEAAALWNRPELRERARKIVLALGQATIRTGAFGTIMLPGAKGFSDVDQPDGPIVNPSYWVYPAFDKLKPVVPEIDWAGLQQSGLLLLQKSRFGPLRVTSDWVALGAEAPAPAKNFSPEFGYNSIRIPLYLAASQIDREAGMPRYGRLWDAREDIGPFVLDVHTGAAKSTLDGRGFKAISALANCAETGQRMQSSMLQPGNDLYYPSTLLLIVTRTLYERYPQCV